MYQAGVKDEHVSQPLCEPICSNQLLRLAATQRENGMINRAGDNNNESQAGPAESVKLSKQSGGPAAGYGANFKGSVHSKPLQI